MWFPYHVLKLCLLLIALWIREDTVSACSKDALNWRLRIVSSFLTVWSFVRSSLILNHEKRLIDVDDWRMRLFQTGYQLQRALCLFEGFIKRVSWHFPVDDDDGKKEVRMPILLLSRSFEIWGLGWRSRLFNTWEESQPEYPGKMDCALNWQQSVSSSYARGDNSV